MGQLPSKGRTGRGVQGHCNWAFFRENLYVKDACCLSTPNISIVGLLAKPKKATRERNLFKVLSPVSRSYLSPKLVCKVAWSCLFEYFFLHEDINPWAVQ